MSFGRANQQWCTFARVWYLINADRQSAGSLAKVVSDHLQGIHKPIYSPSSDVGDHVVVVNAKEIALSGNKWEQKTYHSNTGRKKGRLMMTAAQVHELDNTWIVRRSIYRQLPNHLIRRTLFARLHVFPDENVPDSIMENVSAIIPQPRRVPKTIDDYTEEEIKAFPRLFDWSSDFLNR